MNTPSAKLPNDLPLFFSRRIALKLLEQEADVPAPSAAEVQIEPMEGFEGIMGFRWSLPIADGLVLPVIFEWHERIGPDTGWLAEQAEEIAEFAIGLWHDRTEFTEIFRLLEPKARAAFRRLRRANMPVTLLGISLVPVMKDRQEEAGLRIEFEALDESLQPKRMHLDAFCKEDLEEDETTLGLEQAPRGVLARAIAERGGGMLVDDITLRALAGLGIDRIDALNALDAVTLPIRVADLVGSNGKTIVLHFKDGVLTCTVEVPNLGRWSGDRLSVDGLILPETEHRHRGARIGQFVKHPWIDPDQLVTHAYSASREAMLTFEPKVWLMDTLTAAAVRW